MTDVLPYPQPITSEEIAQAVGHARRRAGFTQAELARRLGRVLNTVVGWENGHHAPTALDFIRLMDACGYTMTILARHSGPPSSAWTGAHPQDVGVEPLTD